MHIDEMKTSTHNGLEVWLEWRPVSSTVGAPGAKDEGKPQQSWTRLDERSPRVTSGEVFVIRGAVEIDVDILAGHGDIEYRLGIKEANYHDWQRDLRMEVSTTDKKVLGIVYVYPGQEQATYRDLGNWSPISQDELACALASKLGIEDIETCLPDCGGIGEEELKALSDSVNDLSDGISGEQTTMAKESDMTLGQAIESCSKEGLSDQEPDKLPGQSTGGSGLEINVFRGQHIELPPTPPPDYIEGDIANGLYNGMTRLSFGENRDEWNPEDPDGVAWCKFIYEITTDSTPLVATSAPYILQADMSAKLIIESDRLSNYLALEAEKKQQEDLRAAEQRLRDEERDRLEVIELANLDKEVLALVATVNKEKHQEARRKGHQTKIRNGLYKDKSKSTMEVKIPTIRRLQDEDRLANKRRTGVLKLRPDCEVKQIPIGQERLQQLGFGKKVSSSISKDNAQAGPSRHQEKSHKPDAHRREACTSKPKPQSPISDDKPLKRTRSFISDGGQIILPPRDEYDTPPTSRLKLPPQERGRPIDRDDRPPEVPKRDDHKPQIPAVRDGKLRRTDEPRNYGLSIPRDQRERRGLGENYISGTFRRIDRSEDRISRRPDSSTIDRHDQSRIKQEPQEHRGEREQRERREQKQRHEERERRRLREVQRRLDDRERRERREAREELERAELERQAEEAEGRLGPMEEQMKAFEEREYQRKVKKAQIERQEERRRKRRLEGSEACPITVPDRAVKREAVSDRSARIVGGGSRLSVKAAIIDMTQLSDSG